MQRISTFFYGIGQGLANIKRNKMFSLASISTMAACLFLFGVFYFVLANFEHMVKKAETNVGITVFFDKGITEKEIQDIGEHIKHRAEVADIIFTSAEEAWDKYKKEKLSAELVETFGNDNPLADSASYTVYLNDITMQNTLVKYIKGLEGVRKVNDKQDIAESLSGFNKVIAVVSGAIILILLAVATFLISTTVTMGVSVRKQEISIMKLIGATDYFIKIPYIVEGAIIGIIGAGIPILILGFGYDRIVGLMKESFSSIFNMVTFLEVSTIMETLVPISLTIGIGIGLIGSNLTLNKQLKKIEVN